MRRVGRWVAAAGAVALAGAAVTGSAGAATVNPPIATGLAGPLQFEVTGKSILVGQSFSGTLSRVAGDGTVTDLLSQVGVDGVAAGRFGRTYFTDTNFEAPGGPTAYIRTRSKSGTVRTLADIGSYEARKNPDSKYTYGVVGADAECIAKLPDPLKPYHGLVDSHPYALARTPWGLFVADAGANAIFFVTWKGKVRTVAVLPPQPTRITETGAEANDLPECVIGRKVRFEAVPTDVELSRKGLVVSTLPGGPEDASLGARGSVYLVGWHGVKRLATGFAGATNVAVSPRGTVYVAELSGNKVSKISSGPHHPYGHGRFRKSRAYGNWPQPKVTTVAELDQPAGLEWANGKLYVSNQVFGPGQISTITK